MPFARLQVTAHRHCMWKYGERAEWAFFFDMDEFLYLSMLGSEKDVDVWIPSLIPQGMQNIMWHLYLGVF